MKFLHHNGWKGSCYFDTYSRMWWGHIVGVRRGIGYHSKEESGMQKAFEAALEAYESLRDNTPVAATLP